MTTPVQDHPAPDPSATRALFMSTLAFTVCFAVWTIFSIIGIGIKQELGLTETQFGLLVGMPILTGSLVRLVLGIWTDRYGGRLVYTVTMLAAAVATFLLAFATIMPQMLVAALGVGIAGGSFAVGVAYVSRFYPAEAGNGARHLRCRQCRRRGHQVHRALRAGRLRLAGRRADLGVASRCHGRHLLVRAPRRSGHPPSGACTARSPSSFWRELAPLKDVRVWRFALYYFFVFGAFVALALWLPRYLIGVYGFDITTAGMIGAAYSIPAWIFRAYGGVLSDRIGARAVMYWTFAVSAVCCARAVLPADGLCACAASAGRSLPLRDRSGRLHRVDLRARLLHEPRQGGGLQAHPGLLSAAASARSAASSA